jgi:hypothetical protein
MKWTLLASAIVLLVSIPAWAAPAAPVAPAKGLVKVKKPGVVAALKFTDKDFGDLGHIWTQGLETKDQVAFSASFGLSSLSIATERFETAALAQEVLQRRLESAQLMAKVQPETVLPFPAAGDACLAFTRSVAGTYKTPSEFYQTVVLVRNNVAVTLEQKVFNNPGQGAPSVWWDLTAIAVRADKRIVEWLEPEAAKLAPAPAPVPVIGKPLPPPPAATVEETGKKSASGTVAAMDFTAKDFQDLGPIKVWEGGANAKDYFAFYLPRDKAADGPEKPLLTVVVSRLEKTADAAALFSAAVDVQAGGRLARVTAGPLAPVGDACGTGPGEVQFIRNNVHVLILDESAGAVDVAAYAKRIDEQLIKWVEAPKDAKPDAPPAAAPTER